MAFNPDVLCTVRLSRALFPRESRHGLDALIERHGLVPSARHRALADADLLWQFWRQLHEIVPLDRLREQIARTTRHFRLAGDLTEAWLDTAPAGCGAYVLFGEDDAPLYVGRSVRVRQRLRALLTGERRSSKEMRLAQQVRRVEWRETGNELGAMLAEAQWIANLRPAFNRRPATDAGCAGADAPWPFDGAVVFEAHAERRLLHVIDDWRYLGIAESLADAVRLAAERAAGPFEPFTYRLLQTHLARGLQLTPLAALAPAV